MQAWHSAWCWQSLLAAVDGALTHHLFRIVSEGLDKKCGPSEEGPHPECHTVYEAPGHCSQHEDCNRSSIAAAEALESGHVEEFLRIQQESGLYARIESGGIVIASTCDPSHVMGIKVDPRLLAVIEREFVRRLGIS